MAHLPLMLPERVELGAVQLVNYKTEIVTTDGGREVRNARWSSPLRAYEINFVAMGRDDPDYVAIVALYQTALGQLHTFNFRDWTDGTGATLVKVRFDAPLQIEGLDNKLDRITQIRLIEVR